MNISLSEIMNLPNITKDFVCTYSPDTFEKEGVSYKIIGKTDFSVKVTNKGNKLIAIYAETDITLEIPCDRCLKSQHISIPVLVDIEVDMNKSAEERAEELDETAFISDFDLDVDHMITEEILMGFPYKVLCKEDCKGICSVCGHDLNISECGCDRAILDPRMAAIAEMFKQKNSK